MSNSSCRDKPRAIAVTTNSTQHHLHLFLLQDLLTQLEVTLGELPDTPINDTTAALPELCSILETIFTYGFITR